MARGRFISNSISTSKKFARLASNDHRLMYLMLLPHADAEGRHDADVRILNGQVYTLLDLPHDAVEAALEDMQHVGLIRLYTVAGERYLEITNFHEHNKVRRRDDGTPSHEAPSTIPAPSDSNDNQVATTEPLRSDDGAATAEDKVQVQVQVEVQEEEQRARTARDGALEQPHPPPDKTSKRKRTTFDPNTVPLPDFVSPDVWRDFVAHRREIRKNLTPRAIELILADLAKTPNDADEMLRTSIKRGWTGVFALDKPKTKTRNDEPNHLPDADEFTTTPDPNELLNPRGHP